MPKSAVLIERIVRRKALFNPREPPERERERVATGIRRMRRTERPARRIVRQRTARRRPDEVHGLAGLNEPPVAYAGTSKQRLQRPQRPLVQGLRALEPHAERIRR